MVLARGLAPGSRCGDEVVRRPLAVRAPVGWWVMEVTHAQPELEVSGSRSGRGGSAAGRDALKWTTDTSKQSGSI